jgi:hypothetical protein
MGNERRAYAAVEAGLKLAQSEGDGGIAQVFGSILAARDRAQSA